MNCPKCHSENVNFQVVSEKQKTGCLMFLLFGIFNALRPSKTKTYAVCQSCGYRWETSPMLNRMNMKKQTSAPSYAEPFCKGVRFYRPSNQNGRVQVMNVVVDGKTKFQLQNGKTHQLDLTPGVHSVKIKFIPYKTETEFTVGDTPVTVECKVVGIGKPEITIK